MPTPEHRSRSRPRVAIAHDYLTQFGGAERVVLSLTRAFPDAPVYTTLYEPSGTFPQFRSVDVRVSALNRLRMLRSDHRLALPALPLVSRATRIDADVVIASSSGWAHGFRADGRMLVYCHSPARWLYLPEQYLGGVHAPVQRAALRALGSSLRRWDRGAAERADGYLANSYLVRDRIREVYGIDADVVHPPHDLDTAGGQQRPAGLPDSGWDSFHLIVSRLMPYKNVEAVLDAFADLPDERIVVVGSGPLADQLRARAPANAMLLGQVSDAELRWLYARAVALLAPSYEDFGLTVIEAAAFGTPAVALRSGGYLETVVDGRTGRFFDAPAPEAIVAAVRGHRAAPINRQDVVEHAREFSETRFIERVRAAAMEMFAAG